ncbi:hypothetical protein GLAREA_12117 [Glarea lozoyensis ATCC 20868]|uniref:Uncharacterized protein n=1 Tax=Glarea lozoyensis (strain ATCC 20868 / MF5171) TaxID=1116229 RepID=S3D2I0_GLAL2|nr:uncharacterized protein GLAREA_12117 [Glarea lozoyensis ATCC 20868]EPE32035.1 hypothetical protein GLAREA_12117 [Glarea lozoyensis ATCC 20868]
MQFTVVQSVLVAFAVAVAYVVFGLPLLFCLAWVTCKVKPLLKRGLRRLRKQPDEEMSIPLQELPSRSCLSKGQAAEESHET